MSVNDATIERKPQRQGVGGTFKAAAFYQRVDALLDLREAAPMSAPAFVHHQEDSRCRFQKGDAPVTIRPPNARGAPRACIYRCPAQTSIP